VGFTERQVHTNGYLQTVGLQHGLEIVADNGWPVGLVGEKLGFVSRKFDIKNNQNGCEQYRGFQRLEFERLSLLFLVEFVVFGGVVAAAFMAFITMIFAVVAAGLAGSGLGVLAAFRFRKHTHVLQLFLTKVFAQGEAGRAEQHRQSEDDM
jgi:hypothetical protein